MSNLYIQAQTLTDIADAIREKAGTSATMTPSQMASAIGSISGGDTTLEDGLVTGVLSSYENSRVSYVRSYAFYDYNSLKTINFLKVQTINRYAFAYCSDLTTINFPIATHINNYAFRGCSSLATISFPKVTTIEIFAFTECSALTTANFPAATIIDISAFYGCRSLTTISFPVVSDIRGYAFANCTALTTISFPSATYIGSSAFRSCHNLLSLYLLGSSVPTLANTNAFYSTPILGYTTSTGGVYGSIYVPASLYSSYITATNWATYSSRFVSV